MKKRMVTAAVLFACATLFSCSKNPVALASEDYVRTLDYSAGFKILQLTDIHWNFTTDVARQKLYLKAIVDAAKPNLIMITGDSLLCANEEIANELYDTIDSWSIPYGVSWGNHDRQGTWSPEWMSKRAAQGSNSLYTEVDDNVSGRSNYVINLVDPLSKKTLWQVYSIDSNSYASTNRPTYGYDSIRQDQIDWYLAQANKAKTANGGVNVPSLSYFHIPLWEWAYAWKERGLPKWTSGTPASQKGMFGEIHEKISYSVAGLTDEAMPKIPFWPANEHTPFFENAVKNGMKAFFCGHDHSNDWGALYQGAYIGYGVKSGRELYYYGKAQGGAYDLIGGSVITLDAGGAYSLKHIFVDGDTFDVSEKEAVLQ